MSGPFSITCASCAYRWREEVPRAASCLWEKCYVRLTGSASWVTTYKHLPAPQHIQLCQRWPHRKSRTPCWCTCSTCSFSWQRRNNSWVSRWVQASVVSHQNQESDLFPFFSHFSFFFPIQPPGLTSVQSAGSVHVSTLAQTGPVLVPEHSGLR